jgi:hypothetical protein
MLLAEKIQLDIRQMVLVAGAEAVPVDAGGRAVDAWRRQVAVDVDMPWRTAGRVIDGEPAQRMPPGPVYMPPGPVYVRPLELAAQQLHRTRGELGDRPFQIVPQPLRVLDGSEPVRRMGQAVESLSNLCGAEPGQRNVDPERSSHDAFCVPDEGPAPQPACSSSDLLPSRSRQWPERSLWHGPGMFTERSITTDTTLIRLPDRLSQSVGLFGSGGIG